MSDLSDKEAAQTVKLTGANSLGVETNFLAVDPYGNLQIDIARDQTSDILGVGISGKRNNQIEISFNSAFDASLITNSQSGGGNATIINGHALYSTGTNATASSKGVSVKSVTYRPAHELYSCFTAAFTTPTSANSYQRIGLFDSNNGFFIGYSGLTFGVTKRTSAVDIFTAKASFNTDTLTGATGSKFTRNGTPEAIDFTKSNLFRVRFAWLGSANILFEVFSPDGEWVLFHNIRQPNTDFNPSLANPNLPMTIEVAKSGADATSLIMATACWGAGSTSDLAPITDPLTDTTLASLTRSVIAGRASTGGGTYYNVKVTPSGSLITAIGDISGVVGQQPMATSFPVVVASDQSPVDAGVTLGNEYVPATPDAGTAQTKLLTDPDNQLKIRGDVLTDEGTFRDDFSGVDLNLDNWTPTQTGNASYSVASSFVTISSGTQNGATSSILAMGDYGPISLRTSFSISQRVANQTIKVGFRDSILGTSALVQFTGTSNAVCTFITSSSSDPSDQQTTTVTFSKGFTSAIASEYYIEVQPDQITFVLNGIQVAQHKLHIPGPYDAMDIIYETSNQAIVTNTNLVVDYCYFINQNSLQVNNSFEGDSLPVRLRTGTNYTYGTAIPAFTYANNGTDIFTITGSDTKTVRIKHLSIDGTQTTLAVRTVNLVKRSSQNTGGTSVILGAVPYDSSNPTATAVVRYYTANPTTLGTEVGIFHSEKVIIPTTNATVEDSLTFSTLESTNSQDITLRGSTEVLAVNMLGVTSNGNSMNIDIMWTEE